ncbi:MAG: outer membrane protein [Methylocystis sp.]
MNFKATILGACASVIALSAATAADLPSRKAPVAPPPPVFSWTGWHGGVVGGYAGGDASYNINRYALNGAAWVRNATAGTSGYIVGYESGYTWQLPNNITIGYEGDYSYTNISPDGGRSYYGGVNSNLTYFGTERLRFGYAMGRLMPYITGGLAYGYFNGVSYGQSNGLWIASGSSANRWGGGWTVGAGLEYALMDHVSVKAEYLYSSIMAPSGGSAVSLNNSGVAVVNGGNYNLNLARVGVNYRVKSIGALLGVDGLGDF